MKKIAAFISIVSSMFLFISCHHGPSRTIHVINDTMELTIKYKGKVRFNEQGTAIESISPSGSVRYEKNNWILKAENNGHGGIDYELSDGNHEMPMDETGKHFVQDAVQEMVRLNNETGRH